MHYRHVKTVLERIGVPSRTAGHILADLEDRDIVSSILDETRFQEMSRIYQGWLVGASEIETPFGIFVIKLRQQLELWVASARQTRRATARNGLQVLGIA